MYSNHAQPYGLAAACALALLASLWLPPAVAAQASFQGPTNFALGTTPHGVAAGDFNGDADPDLAVANYDQNGTVPVDTVSVLLGGTGGSFGTATNFAVGDGPVSVGVGDFNGDLDPDLAVANASSDTVSVLLGGTGGSFGARTDFAAGDGPVSVGVGDFNGDLDPDLAVANGGSDTVSVRLGGTGGSFGSKTDLTIGESPRSIAVGDFNGDSDPDLAVANGDSKVSVLLGGTGGSFGTPTNFAVGTGPFSVAVGDFNGDSDPDLAVVNVDSRNVSVLLGGAGGSFGAATDFAVGTAPLSIAVGDFNRDSDPDLAVANAGNDNVSVVLGGVGGSFGARTDFAVGTAPYSVAVGDFNGDSDPDLAVANFDSKNVSVLLNSVHPPSPPTLTDTDPDSPANGNSPRVKGTAEPGSTVRLYSNTDCSGAPVATGSAAEFGSPGLQVLVEDDSSTPFTAAITSQTDLVSQCSPTPLTYIEDSAPPSAALALSTNPVLTGDTVSFDASASTDQPGGTITRYEWDLDGNGTFETDTGASPTASRSYAAAAEINPAVRVTSSLGQSAVASKPLSIRSRPAAGHLRLGITIDGGARFTNDPDVTIAAVWPRFATHMVLSNDGGFASPLVVPVADSVSWRLDSAGSERLPKTVYARFEGGDSGRETYQDDIILDETSPSVRSATFVGAGAKAAAARRRSRRYRIRLRAGDNAAGIVGYQVTSKRRRPGRFRPLRKRRLQVRGTIRVRARTARLYLRVRDAAGNNSKWRRVKRARPRR